MGEAARKAREASIVSVLIPERGRPEALDRLITSLIQTAGTDEAYEIIVGIDADDPAWLDRTPFEHVRTRYLRREREPTLGEKLNWMAQYAKGNIITFLSNDTTSITEGWPAKIRTAMAGLPNGIGIGYWNDALHQDHTSYWAMTRQMYATCGIFAPPWFPHWFVDTWWDEIGVLTGLKVKIDSAVWYENGNLRSPRPDLAFWVDIFERTRPMRLRDAAGLLGVAFGQGSAREQEEMSKLSQRAELCAARAAHLRTPAFLARWDDGPGPETEAKAIAAKLVADVEAQMPRRVKVAVCVPSGSTWMASTANCVAAAAAFSAMSGIELQFVNVQSSQITNSRNRTVEIALDQGADAVWWVDSDMKFPPDTLINLLRHNKDIVGATYSKRVAPFETLGRLKGPRPPDADLRGGLHEAELLPSGMMLVRTDVYRKLPRPWYAECYRWPGVDHLASFKAMMRDYFAYLPDDEVLDTIDDTSFGRWIAEHGTQSTERGEVFLNFGEDNFFVRKARKHGYQVWCCLDTTFKMVHLGVQEVSCKLPELSAEPSAVLPGKVTYVSDGAMKPVFKAAE